MTILRVTGTDPDGELLAHPEHWEGDGPPPVVLLSPRKNDPAMGPGDRVLAKIGPRERDGKTYVARPITKIAAAARRMLGIFESGEHGGRLLPVEKGAAKEWVAKGDKYKREGRWDDARKAYQKALAINDRTHGAFAGMAEVAFERGDMTRTVLYAKRAARL